MIMSKSFEVEFNITESEYYMLKSIICCHTFSSFDSNKTDKVINDIINCIIRCVEYTGGNNE